MLQRCCLSGTPRSGREGRLIIGSLHITLETPVNDIYQRQHENLFRYMYTSSIHLFRVISVTDSNHTQDDICHLRSADAEDVHLFGYLQDQAYLRTYIMWSNILALDQHT